MTLSASVKHRVPGRLRLQFSESDFDQAELREAIQALRRSPRLRKVQGNPLTRTLLIEAESDSHLQSALREAAEAVVIQMNPEQPKEKASNKPLRIDWQRFRNVCDRNLREYTDGRIDFRAAVILLMTGLGLKQMMGGKMLPAGLTMLMYVAGYLNEVDETEADSDS